MNHRSGVTLVEVLVAIFVLGLGLLAILALFPLAALNMSQAIKDDRTGNAAANADSIGVAWGIRTDPGVQNAMLMPPGNGNAPLPNLSLSQGPSYPVYVDPIGWVLLGHAPQAPPPYPLDYMPKPPGWTGSGMPRTTLRFVNDPTFGDANFPADRNAQIMRWFTLLDDQVSWGDNGVPNPVNFEQRYSWAYLVRAPVAASGNVTIAPAPVIDVTVVVYSGRQQALNSAGMPMGENPYQANFTAGSTIVQVSWTPGVQDKPPLRKGGWILDATMEPDPHGFFYRVVGVTDTGPSSMDVEVQTNVTASANPGVLLVLENVVEVFDKGLGP
jgi:prepilin-type N-terminal cleavage/methylation domain-containing protein